MDKLIRIILMIICGISLPFIAMNLYKPFEDFKELNTIEQILWLLLYIFIANWLVIAPSIIFFKCFEYIMN